MATETLTGSFADAAFSDRAPDGTDLGVTDPIPGVREPIKETAKEPVKEATKEVVKEPIKEEAKDTLDNPHLSSKEVKKEELKESSTEMPAELKKGMTDAAAKKAETAWKSIQESEKKWKTEADTAKAAAATATTELEKLKKQVGELQSLKTELETAKKSLQGYENEMSVTRVEGTKAFKDSVTAPMAEITSTVDDIAKRYEVTPDSLLRVIQEPDKAKRTDAIDEAITDFKHADQLEIVQAAKDYHRIQKVAAEMRENAGAKLKELTEAEKAENDKMTSYNVDLYKSSLDEAFKQIQDRIPYIRNVDGNEKWNGYLKGLVKDAAGVDVNNIPIPSVARALVAERILPDVFKVASHFEAKAKDLAEKLADAEKKLDARTKLGAPAGGGKGANGESKAKTGGSFVDAAFA